MKIFPATSSRTNPDSSLSEGSLVVYENNANLIAGVIVSSKKNKFSILNHKGSVVELPTERLYLLPGHLPSTITTSSEKTAFLENLLDTAQDRMSELSLETVWESFEGKETETTTKQVCQLFFGKDELTEHLITRLALLADSIYFKRKKDTFIARSQVAVSELTLAKEAAERKQKQIENLVGQLKECMATHETPLNDETRQLLAPLEALAAEATEGAQTKEAKTLLDNLSEKLGVAQSGRPEARAFDLLKAVGHFTDNTNLAFYRHNPRIDFPKEVLDEANHPFKEDAQDYAARRDLTKIPTFTIDDITTKDMDDALSLERTESGYQLGIHISDVASIVKPGTLLEEEAKLRATTIYCPELTVNMLPETLSQKHASLIEGRESLCLSYLVNVTSDFKILDFEICRSRINVTKRLTYDDVDATLKQTSGSELDQPIHTLNEIASALEIARIDRGSIRVDRLDVAISVDNTGEISFSIYDEGSPARSLVGEMMVLANHLTATFCKDNKIACVFRSQPEPDVDPFSNPNGIPDGPAYHYLIRTRLKRSLVSTEPMPHSSLGLSLYTQATSPIRRYLDLIIQRQIVHYLAHNEPYYTRQDLDRIILEGDASLQLARYLSTESKRFWLLTYLARSVKNNPFVNATVVRTDLKNPIIHLDGVYLTTPIQLARPVTPGEHLKLKILFVDPRRDQIRFEECV